MTLVLKESVACARSSYIIVYVHDISSQDEWVGLSIVAPVSLELVGKTDEWYASNHPGSFSTATCILLSLPGAHQDVSGPPATSMFKMERIGVIKANCNQET
jgi:hypothetical protein